MRIGVIGPTYPFRGGIAHHTTLLVNALREAGHEVSFWAISRQYPRWLYGRDDRDPSGRPLTTAAERLLDSLNPLSWRRTLRAAAAVRPELILIPWWVPFWAPIWGYLAWGIKRLRPAPHLVFICHNVFPHERHWYDRPALRLALGRADGFVVHARAEREALAELFPEAPILQQPLPTYEELTGDDLPLPFALPGDRPLLLFCGLVRPYKGLDILLAALPRVLAERPVHLLVMGEFWEGSDRYRAQIDALGIGPAVTIEDRYVPNELLAAAVRRADALVLPYRSATQSAVVQLAFGHGVPVITTAVGGLPEAVRDGETGLVVPPEDPEALAAGINRYLREQLKPDFQSNIRREKAHFSWERLVAELVDFGAGL